MPIILTIVIALNAVIFTTLGTLGGRMSRREESPQLRMLARSLAAVALAFVLSSLGRLASLAVREGWLPGDVETFLVSDWLLVQALAVSCLGLGGLYVFTHVADPIRHSERIAAAVTDQLPVSASLTEMGLTSRELEVLEIISTGELTDKGIADVLFISPSTAGTHVKNIMRKAEVSSRRDLRVLTAMQRDPATPKYSTGTDAG